MAAGTHPDLLLIEKPPDKNVLPIELFVGRREHRMQEGLCHDLGLKPFSASRRISVIDDAQLLNEESANCLLKTLEEPPPGAVIVLISTAEDQMLSTIRSRCQTIRFRPLTSAQIAAILVRDGSVSGAGEAQQIAAQSEGSMRVAQALAAPEMQQFHGALLAQLTEPAPDSQALVDLAVAFIEAGGRDAPLRRERARHVVGTALEFYRQVVRTRSGLAPLDGSELHPAVERSCREWRADDEAVVRCAQRCPRQGCTASST